MHKSDVDALTAEDFRFERREVMKAKRIKAREEAFAQAV